MAKRFKNLTDKHIEFIEQQKIYFVGTAADVGSVNLSPKGSDSLRVINATKIAWLNLTGSGNESAAHVLQNPRMTLMFCAFEGSALILRVYGQTKVLHNKDPEWGEYLKLFPNRVGARQIFILNIDLVQSSCGTSVPYFKYEGERDDLIKWSEQQGYEGIKKYWLKRNQKSIDGFDTEITKRSKI